MEQIIYLLYRTTNIIGNAQQIFLGTPQLLLLFILMQFRAAALHAALVLVPACAERLYVVPDMHPGISSIEGGIMIARGDEWGGGDGGAVIAPRRFLRGKQSKAQHSAGAVIAVMASFAFISAAVIAVVVGGDVGGGGSVSGNGGGGGGGNNSVVRRGIGFPGPARIVRPNMHEHLILIFWLMAERRVHVESGARSKRAIAAWQNVFDQYFNPINGTGRAWAMWSNPCKGVAKFRKSVMAALEFHHAAFLAGEAAPSQVQILANDLMVERIAAIAAKEAAVARQVQHQGRLQAANQGMGLVPPGRGVAAHANLGFNLTHNQEIVLSELAQRTWSVDTPCKNFVIKLYIFFRDFV